MRSSVFLIALLSLAMPTPARAEVRLTMHDGVVSLTAKDATVRQILAEWAKVGQTKIVDAEGITGGPISLQLVDVPERQALDIILRTVSGYLAAPRQTIAANLSRFDRVLILPTSAPVSTAARQGAATPAFPQPRSPLDPPGMPSVDDADDDVPFPNAPPPAPPLIQRGQVPQPGAAIPAPVPSTFPAPVAPQAPPVTVSPYITPGTGGLPGAAVPGMIVQPPAPPNTPQPQP